jgi:hypothetical protein
MCAFGFTFSIGSTKSVFGTVCSTVNIRIPRVPTWTFTDVTLRLDFTFSIFSTRKIGTIFDTVNIRIPRVTKWTDTDSISTLGCYTYSLVSTRILGTRIQLRQGTVKVRFLT